MLSQLKILTIDDSATVRHYLRRILSQRGAAVEGVETGRAGVDQGFAQKFDLILLDLMLPDMNGIEVLREFRARDDETAVIVLTGEGGIKAATAALQQGADGYIEKQEATSGDTEAFLYQLQKAVERRRALVAERTLRAELAEKVEQLKISEQKAMEANRAKSAFLANMSHELRTPLNAILGFVQLLNRDENLTDRQVEVLGIINRSGEHLLGLINDVLSISKIETGRLTLNEHAFNLRALLDSLRDMLTIRAQSKGLYLVFELSDELPEIVRGDEGKLRQCFINLIGNGIKFTESGGVMVRVEWEDGLLRCVVDDTGHGIADEEQAKLFEPFVQTESGRKSLEGTGLGLAITRNFIRLMGGDVSVSSQFGRGSSFLFTVSLERADRADLAVTESRRVEKLAEGQAARRILVVDDTPENRQLLCDLLQGVGFETKEAVNGADGVTCWREWQPDFIWMDMRMPVMNGLEATREIRRIENEENRSRTPVIALTASGFEHEMDAVNQAGCDELVLKPFRASTIFETLAKYLKIEYVYSGGDPAKSGGPAAEAPTEPTRERLAELPAEAKIKLLAAVTEGDVRAATVVVDALEPTYPGLAKGIRALVRQYRFEELQEMLEPEAESES